MNRLKEHEQAKLGSKTQSRNPSNLKKFSTHSNIVGMYVDEIEDIAKL